MKNPPRPVSVKSLWIFLAFLAILFIPFLAGSICLQLRLFVEGANALSSEWLKWLMAVVVVGAAFSCWLMLLNGARFFGAAHYRKLVVLCLLCGLPLEVAALIHFRASLRNMVAHQDGAIDVSRGEAQQKARQTAEASLLTELTAAQAIPAALSDRMGQMDEVREEIARLVGQAGQMDNDGIKANDREIPSFLARAESKKNDLANLEATCAALRAEHGTAIGSVQQRLDRFRAESVTLAGDVAVAGAAVNCFSQFAKDLDCMLSKDGWRTEEGMLNLELTFLALVVILANWACSAGVKGMFVIFERIEDQGAQKDAKPLSVDLNAGLAAQFYDQVLANATYAEKRSVMLAAKRAGFELPLGTAVYNSMGIEDARETIIGGVITPFLAAAAQRRAA